jgi:putative salt-induced outer membrane protein YdiY
MKKYLLAVFVVIMPTCIFDSGAAADEIWLKNGDHLTGKIVRLEANSLVFNTGYAGEIAVKWEQIKNLKTDTPVKVMLGDKTAIEGVIAPGENGSVTVTSPEIKAPLTVDLARLTVINPKPPEPPVKTNVRVNFGASFTDGNTQTESIYGDGELVARTVKNRFTLGGLYLRSENEDVTTADRILGYMKYDYFLSKKWYLYASLAGEKDEFKDLNLRSTAGLGLGYQFFETDTGQLSLDGGASYVNNDRIQAEDNGYSAGRWGVKFEYFLLKKVLQFFHYDTGFQSFENSDDLLIYTQTGLRIPLYKNLNSTIQFNYDYDKNPAPGKENDDSALIFTLGYQWAG